MVALLTPNTIAGPRNVGTAVGAPRSTRPQLRLLQGGSAKPVHRSVDVNVVAGVFALILLVAAVLGVRVAQGTPPAEFQNANSQASAQSPALAVGEYTVRVGAGENLWDVARAVNPLGDARATVVALSDRNGSATVVVGQEVVVPVMPLR